MDIQKQHEDFDLWWEGNAIAMMCEEDEALKIWQAAKAQAVQEGLRKNQEKVKVYELHVKTLKQIHENEFNEKSESSYILGNLDGFFECLESDLGEIK